MTVNISTQARNDAGNAIVDLIDKGATKPNGYIEIRNGTKPTNPQTGATGTLLATMNHSLPAFGNFNNGTSLANAIVNDINVDETGVASWFRIYDRNGIAIIDGDITTTGGSGDIKFDNVNFIRGGVVAIVSLVANMPQ